MCAQRLLDAASWGILAGACFWSLSRYFPDLALALPGWPLLAGGPIFIALVLALLARPSSRKVAMELDRRAAAKDRFLTVLALPDARAEKPVEGAILREAEAFAQNLRVREYFRFRWPRRPWLLMLLPIVGWLALTAAERARKERNGPELANARAMIEKIEKAAQREGKKDPELQKTAEQLKAVNASLENASDPMREAMRALADLEKRLAQADGEGRAADAKSPTPAGHGSSPQPAPNGNQASASQTNASLTPEQLAQAIQDAERHRAQTEMQQMAERMGGARMKPGDSRDNSPNGDGGAKQRFLSSLRDIRSGGEDQNQGSTPDGSPSRNNRQQGAVASDPGPPSGSPGSDHDEGQGSELKDSKDRRPLETAYNESLAGQLGDGSSLIKTYRAAGQDDSKARKAYQSVFDTAEAAALETVSQENVPAGSRLLVRRYFEAIRPPE